MWQILFKLKISFNLDPFKWEGTRSVSIRSQGTLLGQQANKTTLES